MMILEDGAGTGSKAKIDATNRLWVDARIRAIQNYSALFNEESYQVVGTATLASGTVCGLHLTNNSSTKNAIITYIRHQVIDAAGGTAFPNASNYFSLRLGRAYSSGGSTATVVNTTSGSSNTSETTVYQGAPTLTGTALELDRWYTKSEADMNSFSKEGSLIIPPTKTIELSYIGDHTSGTLYTRLSFLMEEI